MDVKIFISIYSIDYIKYIHCLLYMSYYDKIPIDLQTYIGYFIPYKRKRLIFLEEFEEIIIDWYNKTRIEDISVYQNYNQIVNVGIKEYEIESMCKGFNNYFNDRKNYYLIFCPYVGRFKRVYKRKTCKEI